MIKITIGVAWLVFILMSLGAVFDRITAKPLDLEKGMRWKFFWWWIISATVLFVYYFL